MNFLLISVVSENSTPGLCKQIAERLIINRSPKESVSSLIEMKRLCSTKGRPVWIIGSEDESLRSCESKLQEIAKAKMDFNKNHTRVKSTSSNASINLTNGTNNVLIVCLVKHKLFFKVPVCKQ